MACSGVIPGELPVACHGTAIVGASAAGKSGSLLELDLAYCRGRPGGLHKVNLQSGQVQSGSERLRQNFSASSLLSEQLRQRGPRKPRILLQPQRLDPVPIDRHRPTDEPDPDAEHVPRHHVRRPVRGSNANPARSTQQSRPAFVSPITSITPRFSGRRRARGPARHRRGGKGQSGGRDGWLPGGAASWRP